MVRSKKLMNDKDTLVLVVDMQERLIPAITDHHRLVWNVCRLIDGAFILGLPVAATEQYPQKLGASIPEISQRLEHIDHKRSFSCCGSVAAVQRLRDTARKKVLICGIEAHVCVQQTVLDLLEDEWAVFVAADAVGSRFEIDYALALKRMQRAGAVVTTTEAALFEWCATSDRPEFKGISNLVKQQVALTP